MGAVSSASSKPVCNYGRRLGMAPKMRLPCEVCNTSIPRIGESSNYSAGALRMSCPNNISVIPSLWSSAMHTAFWAQICFYAAPRTPSRHDEAMFESKFSVFCRVRLIDSSISISIRAPSEGGAAEDNRRKIIWMHRLVECCDDDCHLDSHIGIWSTRTLSLPHHRDSRLASISLDS